MENIKSKIIPEELKRNIDEVMERQLFNANRYYAESNPDISRLMKKELYTDPVTFYKKLVDRWRWHNSFYEELLEPAYSYIVKDSDKELSPKEIEDLINIYKTCINVDEATLVMSGVIKKYLDFNVKNIPTYTEGLTIDEANVMMITPPTETFFSQYMIDHLYYIYMLKTNDSMLNEQKKFLMKKYHANDEVIFKTRFNKRFSSYLDKEPNMLLKDIKRYEIPDYYKTSHFYFTLEHPERKAIRDIIVYDNLDEKLIASSLIGVSGFLLRRKILEYLNNSKMLENDGFIYEFSNKEVIDALEKLKILRGIEMDKDVKVYKQRGDMCAIACLMMALEYYKVMEKANWYDEKRLYRIYGSKFMPGTPFSALAYHFSKNGINNTIYHSEQELFKNDSDLIDDSSFNLAMDEYKEFLNRAKQLGTEVVSGIKIDIKLLREKLEEGKLVILAGEIYGGFHAILLSGYEDNKFIVCDPLYREKQYKSKEEIERFMDTSIGKWFITVDDMVKEKVKLVDSLDDYREEAEVLLEKKKRGKAYVKR